MTYKNNPGNLRFSNSNNWKGSLEPKNGFCQFATPEYGIRAMMRVMYVKLFLRGVSLREAIHEYAPASDGNDPSLYYSYVIHKLNSIDILSTNLHPVHLPWICYYMSGLEQGGHSDNFELSDFLITYNSNINEICR